MVSALADAKIELASVQELLAQKDSRIAELQDAFSERSAVRRINDGIYRVGPHGGGLGAAYWLRCWEADQRLRPLVQSAKEFRNNECHFCRSQYAGSMTCTFRTEVDVPDSDP